MKKNNCIASTIILSLSLLSCANFKRSDAIGMYVSRNNLNTIDSLWILDNGEYVNLIYRKNDKSLIYKNTGEWEFEDNYVVFDHFFVDQDEFHGTEYFGFEDILITTKLPLERMSGKVIIHHKSMYDNIYLEKVN